MQRLEIRRHPFLRTPEDDVFTLKSGDSIINVPPRFECFIDGERVEHEVLADDLHDNAVVIVKPRCESDVLRTLAQIAIAAAAIAIGQGWLLGLSGFWAAAAGAAILVGGNILINALFPIKPPSFDGNLSQPDPQYSLTAGQNLASQYGALKLVLGTHRMFPDLAAEPYVRFIDNDQYLYQIFDFGIGNLTVTDIKIEDTPIANYNPTTNRLVLSSPRTIGEIQPDSSTETIGVELTIKETAEAALPAWVTRTISAGPNILELDFTGTVYTVNQRDGSFGSRTAVIRVEHKKTTETSWTGMNINVTGDDSTVVRKTFSISIEIGSSYNLRVRSTTTKPDSNTGSVRLGWNALRTFTPDSYNTYAGRNRYALVLKATGQLSGSVRNLNVTVSQKVPVWENNAWSAPKATSNPAWILRAFAQGWKINRVTVAGAGLPLRRIDDDSIKRLGVWCDNHNPPLRYNAIIDGTQKAHDVLTDIARAARARLTWASGKLGVAFEDSAATVAGSVTPGNIVAGTFQVNYVSGDRADEVGVSYIEPDLDWQRNTVRRKMPGVTNPSRPTSIITMPGITDKRLAALFANLLAANNLYHQKRFRWRMPIEGILYHTGDVLNLSHSLVHGGETGNLSRIVKDSASSRVVSFEPVTVNTNDQLMIIWPSDGVAEVYPVLLRADPDDPSQRLTVDTTDTIMLNRNIPDARLTETPYDTKFILYPTTAPPLKVRVASVVVSNREFEYDAYLEDPLYHRAATSDLRVNLPPRAIRIPKITNVEVFSRPVPAGSGWVMEVGVIITATGDWQNSTVEVTRGGRLIRTLYLNNGAVTARWIDTVAGEIVVTVFPGSREAPVGEAVSETHTIESVYQIIPSLGAPTNFTVTTQTAGIRRASWRELERADAVRYELLYSVSTTATVGSMTSIGFFAGSGAEFGQPAGSGTYRFAIRAWTRNNTAGLPAYLTATLGAVLAGGGGTQGPRGENGIGTERLFTVASTETLDAAQYPDDAWGYKSGGTRGGQRWTSDPQNTTEANPFPFFVQRDVPGEPSVGATVTDQWSVPVAYGRRGIDGQAGQDGIGAELIFARTALTVNAVPSTQLPLNSWTYDQQNGGFITVGGLRWYDGAVPKNLGGRLWAALRRPTGPESVLGQAVSDTWKTPFVWADDGVDGTDGDDGEDGESLESLWCRTDNPRLPPNSPNPHWNYQSPGIIGFDRVQWAGTVSRPSGQSPAIAVVSTSNQPSILPRRWADDDSQLRPGWIGLRSNGNAYIALHTASGTGITGPGTRELKSGVERGLVLRFIPGGINALGTPVGTTSVSINLNALDTTAPYEWAPPAGERAQAIAVYNLMTAGSTCTVQLICGSPSNYQHPLTLIGQAYDVGWFARGTRSVVSEGNNKVIKRDPAFRVPGNWTILGNALEVEYFALGLNGYCAAFFNVFDQTTVAGRFDDAILRDLYVIVDQLAGTVPNETVTKRWEFPGPSAPGTLNSSFLSNGGYSWRPSAAYNAVIQDFATSFTLGSNSNFRVTLRGGHVWKTSEQSLTPSAYVQWKSQRAIEGSPTVGMDIGSSSPWTAGARVGSLPNAIERFYSNSDVRP